MNPIREAAVARAFYPGDPELLREAVAHYLQEAAEESSADLSERPPKVLVVPHAGYIYSGPVAATAYARLRSVADRYRRVVLLGPAHRVYFEGIAAPAVQGFDTPLGVVPVDQDAIARMTDLPGVVISDVPHRDEHCLEVQLPFLQEVLSDFMVVPLVVGDVAPGTVAQVLDALWGGPETLIVISSDLSHYHRYEVARQLDQATCAAIVGLQPAQIGEEAACGRTPLRGMLQVARQHGLQGHLLDYRNSGDTAGPRDRVVGYAACVFD